MDGRVEIRSFRCLPILGNIFISIFFVSLRPRIAHRGSLVVPEHELLARKAPSFFFFLASNILFTPACSTIRTMSGNCCREKGFLSMVVLFPFSLFLLPWYRPDCTTALIISIAESSGTCEKASEISSRFSDKAYRQFALKCSRTVAFFHSKLGLPRSRA